MWQLADSAFPTGGFAHSAGLEAAAQHGQIRNRDDLVGWIQASLGQQHRMALPFVDATHRHPALLPTCDRLFDAHTVGQVANRASRAQGRAFLAATRRIFDVALPPPPCGHWPPTFGAVCRALNLDSQPTLELFLFSHLRTLTAAAVRLNLVGPLEAQAVQHRMTGFARRQIDAGIPSVDEAAQTAPLLELWQGGHDRLDARLFQS